MPSPLPIAQLHPWLDAIAQGQADGRPQLDPDAPVPSVEALRHLREVYAQMTGVQLTETWLAQVLSPATLPAVKKEPAAPSSLSFVRRTRSWWTSVKAECRPALDWCRMLPLPRFATRARWKIAQQRVASAQWATGLLGGFLFTGGLIWRALWVIGPQHELNRQVAAAAKALGGFKAFSAPENQAMVQAFHAQYVHLAKLDWASNATVATGFACLGLFAFMSWGRERLSVSRISPFHQALWSRSPKVQHYLRERVSFDEVPFLRGELRQLNGLAAQDGLFDEDGGPTDPLPRQVNA